MSFGAPALLVALALLPVAAYLYVAGERRRRGAAGAFAGPALLASVAPKRPRWRRHVPFAIYGLALAALIVAAAKPKTTVAVPVERATVMLVTDVSGSMQARDVKPTRMAAARNAARSFVDDTPKGVRVGIIAFNQTPRTLQAPTADRAALRTALARLRSSGGTATGEAMQAALQILQRQPGVRGKRPPSAIVLLSDGVSTRGRAPLSVARDAAKARIPIHTITLGTPTGTIQVPRPQGQQGTETRRVPPDPQTMRAVARTTKAQAFAAGDTDELDSIYDKLGSQLGTRKEKREITAGFIGGALALLALGGAFSLRWTGRLP